MENTFKAQQSESYLLREYIVQLQSRLLEVLGEYPPPPPGINLSQPNNLQAPAARGAQPEASQAAAAPAAAAAPTPAPAPGSNPLEVAAQAVAGLSRSEHLAGRDAYTAAARTDDDVRTAEEITRQLQADGGPDGLPTAPM